MSSQIRTLRIWRAVQDKDENVIEIARCGSRREELRLSVSSPQEFLNARS